MSTKYYVSGILGTSRLHSMTVLRAFAAAQLILLLGCSSEEHSPQKRHNLCEHMALCIVAPPPSVVLKIAAKPVKSERTLAGRLKRDFPQGGVVFDIGPPKQAGWTDRRTWHGRLVNR